MIRFPSLSESERLAMLALPKGPVSMVLDTDTFNEIDDQFAVAYALMSPNLSVEAIYAAPFANPKHTPGVGMEKSYEEILRVMDRMGHDPGDQVFRGSQRFLPSATEPVRSPAAEDLIAKASQSREGMLYVLAIGAITNVASALLLEPSIAARIVVVWLGGQPYYWPTASEYNLWQDTAAARVVFDSGVPLVHIPCKNVAEHLRTTLPEMALYVREHGALGAYLYAIFEGYHDDHYAYSKVIWDISAVAYLNNPDWVPTALRPSPILQDDVTWGPVDPSRHRIREAYDVNRDAIFGDLFRKLQARADQKA